MSKDMRNGLVLLSIAAIIGVAVGIAIAANLGIIASSLERKEVVSTEQIENSKLNSPTETLLWAGYGAWDGNPYRTIIQLYPDSEEKSKIQVERFNMQNLVNGDDRQYGIVEIYIRRAE